CRSARRGRRPSRQALPIDDRGVHDRPLHAHRGVAVRIGGGQERDRAAAAGAHRAGHRTLKRGLAPDPARPGEVGDLMQEPVRTAGEDLGGEGRVPRLGPFALEQIQGAAGVSHRAVVGRQVKPAAADLAGAVKLPPGPGAEEEDKVALLLPHPAAQEEERGDASPSRDEDRRAAWAWREADTHRADQIEHFPRGLRREDLRAASDHGVVDAHGAHAAALDEPFQAVRASEERLALVAHAKVDELAGLGLRERPRDPKGDEEVPLRDLPIRNDRAGDEARRGWSRHSTFPFDFLYSSVFFLAASRSESIMALSSEATEYPARGSTAVESP